MLKLNNIIFENEGKRISYDYEYSYKISKYFSNEEKFFVEYEFDISSVPYSIAVIPFISNFMPIAWFAGFNIFVDEIDEKYTESINELKNEFSLYFKKIKLDSMLISNKTIKNIFSENNTCLLFSGGLDSFDTLTRNINKDPYLVSVYGADIDIGDEVRWEQFKKFNNDEEIINNDKLFYVKSNVRKFYTYHVDLLVDIGWWGKIQHGMSLTSLIAPLTFIKNITTIHIASSQTQEVKKVGWGSTKEGDEKIYWANLSIIHDGYDYNRPQKIANVVNFSKMTQQYCNLRVCYSELRNGANCNKCTKCQRTIFGILLNGENPNKYGFRVPSNFYIELLSNFNDATTMTVGIMYEWLWLQDKIKTTNDIFFIKDKKEELKYINLFLNLDFTKYHLENSTNSKISLKKKIKYILISKFPNIFKKYSNLKKVITK